MLWILVFVLFIWMMIDPDKIRLYPQLVDWPTIQILFGLLILTRGIESSGWLENLSVRIVERMRGERVLALFLIALSILLAMVLTNDVALFVVVPLTLTVGRVAVLPLKRLIVFEALAVNCGSLLSPIGNPQNIFIWQRSGVHILSFMLNMLPLFMFCLVVLAIFVFFAFRPMPVDLRDAQPPPVLNRRLLYISGFLYLPFLIMDDLHYAAPALAIIAVVFLVVSPRVISRIDWPLLIVFVLMFIDLRLLSDASWIKHVLLSMNLGQHGRLFVASLFVSQVISNVPASILLAGHSNDWSTLAWGVNVGGFGLVTGSLANLIALRIGRQRGGMLEFHVWALPFLLVLGTMALIWLWLV